MDAKRRFTHWVAVTVLVLFLVNLLLWQYLRKDNQDTVIALCSLTVDLAVGFLTVFALRWAASQFAEGAVRPKVRLEPASDYVEGEGYVVPRPEQGFNARVYLNLRNETSRAGRFVQLAIRVHTCPVPRKVQLIHTDYFRPAIRGLKDSDRGAFVLMPRYPEEVVVYQAPTLAGLLMLHWKSATPSSQLPVSMELSYTAYTLDGAHSDTLVLPINWTLRD